MKRSFSISLLICLTAGVGRALPQDESPAAAEPPAEIVTPGASFPASTQLAPAGEGFMEPQQVKEFLKRVYLSEYRINDLFTQVRPESWNMPEGARKSFQDTFGALQKQMGALEEWRVQLDGRPDSMYLAYMLHASIDAILPRLDGVTRIITQRENSSLGAQFSQAGNQLFDLQQSLQPYLVYLLRNQDQALYAAQTNLAGCETRLGAALRQQQGAPKILKNIVPDFKGRRARKPTAPASQAPAAGANPPKTATAPR